MSELCRIHGVPLSEWLSECPACRSEKDRQQELLDAHRAQQEAIGRQTDQLREAAEAEAERALEAQWALDDIAASSKSRLEEDRLHRQAEAARATLRAGVRELAPALQVKWQEVNKTFAQAVEAANVFSTSRAALAASLERLTAARTNELQTLVARESDKVREALISPGPTFIHSLPENRLAPASLAQTLRDPLLRASKAAEPYLSGRAPAALGDPTLATSLYPVLKAVEDAKETFASESKNTLERFSPLELGCVGTGMAVFWFFAFGIVAQLLAQIVLNLSSTLVNLVSIGAGALGAFGVVYWLVRERVSESHHRAFDRALAELSSALSESRIVGTSATLLRHLTQAYVLSSIDSMPNVELYQAAARKAEQSAKALQALEQNFRDSEPERERCRREYVFLREEVMRVGREIIEGIRAPGRLLQATNCKQCGGPATSETKQCPYCRSGLFSSLEA